MNSFGCSSNTGVCTTNADCTTQGESCVSGRCKAEGGSLCAYDGKSYKEGDSFPSSDGCNTCRCASGLVGCTDKLCNSACQYEGKTYQEGQSFKSKDGCNSCSCKASKVECTTKTCPGQAKECSGSCTDKGEYCHYEKADACGETNEKGSCKSKPTNCPDDGGSVCGCDGKTYDNLCLAHAAGTSVQKEGACEAASGRCGGSAVCSDLKKKYCHYEKSDACGESNGLGTCKDRPTTCPDEDKPVCGCDSKTYENACLAYQAGTSVQREGACEVRTERCGGSAVCSDLQKKYCHYEVKDACGKTTPLGTCKDRPTECSKEIKTVCGCNGKTYSNSCLAHVAGTSVEKEGSCQPGASQCNNTKACAGKDEYCHYESKLVCGEGSGFGVCKKKPATCTKEDKPVCGCDGKTYSNSCMAYAAGSSVRYEGACCNTKPKACGGLFNVKCQGANDYCHLELKDLCGAADAMGVCKTKPTKCQQNKDPVCGCDTKDYNNTCAANAAGVSVSFKGVCKRPPGSCIYKGNSYHDTDSFQYACDMCTCMQGKVSCTPGSCNPTACGTKATGTCPAGQYCDQAKHCGTSATAGVCKLIRTAPCFGGDPTPVCGCDKKTYRSACDAEVAGVSVQSTGACKCP